MESLPAMNRPTLQRWASIRGLHFVKKLRFAFLSSEIEPQELGARKFDFIVLLTIIYCSWISFCSGSWPSFLFECSRYSKLHVVPAYFNPFGHVTCVVPISAFFASSHWIGYTSYLHQLASHTTFFFLKAYISILISI
ncbi:hypothetical protein IGI04_002550 [Brassica rapa subsp. trilocularis]|uniref:Uncharacterized protein n=1 Tax=Brassica rapa subsp. trilocularis TaxID=1813537 RepID=A0ABQ7NVV1_BRACM|nr:hypothetical protein IGI04_034562 [Brassica rapa subsp. trilocularis]KAG5388241.1 hypothetical protein IGI04_029782 [Brassica rapa subsp. trilocularis]KAG5414983.1 hypothetical protein IGI04_002550 [Brassica rapa subsp. trilocularis]